MGQITFKETFHDFAYSMFSVDAPLVNTLKLLVVNPGKLFREFLSGKRKHYYKPVAFFILTTVMYLLIRSLLDYNPFQDTSIINVGDSSEYVDGRKLTLARNFMLLNIDKLLFVFIFVLALYLKLFFFKKYSLAEYVAIAFYLIGVYTIFATLNMFYIHYTASEMHAGALLLMFIYFTYAIVSTIKKNRIWVLIKLIPLYFLAIVSYALIAFGISYIIISIKS
ncbi:MAG: DUF3667 domain-containing protein [Maribacter sp.]|uniref:DUF3667 domain-containing protein n=1 Tax=Maribacter sp. TaxID=1897614 RepID=UPI003298EEE3